MKKIFIALTIVVAWLLFIFALGFYPTATGLAISLSVIVACSIMAAKVMMEDWSSLGNERS